MSQFWQTIHYLSLEAAMESSGLSRFARRLSVVFLFVPAIAILPLVGCGSSSTISSISSTVQALNDPRGIVVDSSQNVYIADAGNHVIREAQNSSDTLFPVAGELDNPGFSGDGGIATSAQLYFPQGVALDSSGHLYIADTGNNRIREVTAGSNGFSNGTITTIAGNGTAGFSGDGGAATSAQLNNPLALALDSAGNLYIADTGNNVIRKIAGGVITTVAGNGTAGFSGDGGAATSAQLHTPSGIALDASGNLYIADQTNEVIREVSASTGMITTAAGNGTAGFSGDGTTATSAQLNSPQAVAVDGSGNLYIADTGNNRIRKVSGGTISTAVGNGTPGYSGDGHSATGAELLSPNALAFDTSGALYIDDAGNKSIRKVSF